MNKRSNSQFRNGMLAAAAALIGLVFLGLPSPASACEPDPMPSNFYRSRITSGALPIGVTVGVGQELIGWMDDPQSDHLILDRPAPDSDYPINAHNIEYSLNPIIAVRNLTESTIYVLQNDPTDATPDPLIPGLRAGMMVAHIIEPQTAVAFDDIPDANFYWNYRDLKIAPNNPPAELDAPLDLLIDGEIVHIDMTVTVAYNPKVETAASYEDCVRGEQMASTKLAATRAANETPVTALAKVPQSYWQVGLLGALGVMVVIGIFIAVSRAKNS